MTEFSLYREPTVLDTVQHRQLRLRPIRDHSAASGMHAAYLAAVEFPAAAREYPALRYVPSRPTYAIAAKTVRAAQRGLADLADSFGLVLDIDRGRLGGELRALFGVDPFSPEELAAVGMRLLAGSWLGSELIEHVRTRRLKVTSRPGMWFNVDGELVSNEPIVFEAVPKAMQVIIGPEWACDSA